LRQFQQTEAKNTALREAVKIVWCIVKTLENIIKIFLKPNCKE